MRRLQIWQACLVEQLRLVIRVLVPAWSTILRFSLLDLVLCLIPVLYLILATRYHYLFSEWPLKAHFYYQNKHCITMSGLRVVPLLFVFVLLMAVVARFGRRGRTLPVLLLIVAISMQWAFSCLEGISGQRLSRTLIHPHFGHSEFVAIAHEDRNLSDIATNYESLCRNDQEFVFSKSKPPGQLLFYSITARIFQVLRLEQPFRVIADKFGFYKRDPLTSLGAFVTIMFSIFSCLPVLVLYKLGKVINDETLGEYCALTFIACPAINLVTMHLDQVLYPLLVSLVLLCSVLAVQRHWAIALIVSALVYLSVYISFSLLFVLPMIIVLWGSYFLLIPKMQPHLLKVSAVFTLGLLLCFVAFQCILNFRLWAAYQRAIEFHAAWRNVTGLIGWRGNIRNTGYPLYSSGFLELSMISLYDLALCTTNCSTSRWKIFPTWRDRLRLKRKENSSR